MPEGLLIVGTIVYLLLFVIVTFCALTERCYNFKVALFFNILAVVLSSWLLVYCYSHEKVVENEYTERITTITTAEGTKMQYVYNKHNEKEKQMVRLDGLYENPDEYEVQFKAYRSVPKYWVREYDPEWRFEIVKKVKR